MANLASILRTCALAATAAWTFTAAAQAPSPAEAQLAGTWLGEFTPAAGAPTQRFITTRRADGTFTVQARMYQNGKRTDEVRNAGLWGVSNGMYFTVITEVNGARSDPRVPDAMNAYLVKTLEPDRFDYVHVASGSTFTVRRVDPARAQLPD